MVMKLKQWALAAVVLGALSPGVALAQTMSMVWDNFSTGFTVDTPGAKWTYFGAGTFTGNNGVVSTSSQGLSVRAPTHPTTNKPAFTLTVAPEAASGLPGGLDHVKWLAYMNTTSSWGYPGFSVASSEQFTCSTTISGRTYGTEYHPFGTAVSNAQADPRLAAIGMNTIDFESYMVFDFFFTNEKIYAIYERLPFGRTETNHYAAFTYAIPVGTRMANNSHQVAITYNRALSRVTWKLDGVEVYRVDTIGYRLPRQNMIIDHGGTEQSVSMRQLNCGMGMFTLLDASMGGGSGLVRLSSNAGFYYLPTVGTSSLSFVDESSQPGSRLFKQGASFSVGAFSVSRGAGTTSTCTYAVQPTGDMQNDTSLPICPDTR
ncbi:MAG TPA: DUF6081 family protein [Myxococcaceae bacterium]|nr:DUF6081 family protein [Myxococcaceae bacterium]